jgi:hypothetical protein
MSGCLTLIKRLFGMLFGRPWGRRDAVEDEQIAETIGPWESAPERSSRRQFLGIFGAGLVGLAAAFAGVPILRAFFATPPRREPIWHVVGEVDVFPMDETVKVEFTDPDAVPWAGPAART